MECRMSIEKTEAAIEAILFTMGESVEAEKIAVAIEHDIDTTVKIIHNMMDKYENEDRGIKIIELEGSFQLCTKEEYYDNLIRICSQPRRYTLTDAALETLSIIAYKQPVTKIEIEKIRGVNSDRSVNKLVELELVKEVGYSSAFTFIYSRRNNTPADMMLNQVSEEDKHHRFNRLVAAVNERVIAQNKAEEGNILEVLVEGNSKNDAEKLTGRTRTGRLVNFTGENVNVGELVNVKITRAQNFSLIGEVIK